MSKSLKINYIFNLTNTISGLLFPVITFPYASRIMLAEGIGQVNFFSSIIAYISLFTCLGIPMYAIRETARVRNNEKELSKTSTEILLLHAGLTVLGYLLVALICLTVDKVKSDIFLFLLLSTNIFFVAIGCDWFYQGIEDFKYITIRGLIVKVVSVILLFVFVKSKDDIMYYAAYSVIGVVGGNVFNFIRLRKFINIKLLQIRDLKPLRHLKPALRIFVLNLIISVYINLDTVMLGFMKDPAVVGYYTGATKLTKILTGIVGSLGTVMLPRLSHLTMTGQKDEFNRLAQKSIDVVMALSLPLFLGLIVLAPVLIRLFCGPSYEPAILTLQIISPILLFIAISNVLGIQILYPQGHEKLIIYSALIGAIINIVLNLLLIPYYSQDGAAIATVIAELGVTSTMIITGSHIFSIKIFSKRYINYVLGATIMFILCFCVQKTNLPDIGMLVLVPLVGGIIYIGFLYLRKDIMVTEIITLVRNKILK